jgi:hypothetical protein
MAVRANNDAIAILLILFIIITYRLVVRGCLGKYLGAIPIQNSNGTGLIVVQIANAEQDKRSRICYLYIAKVAKILRNDYTVNVFYCSFNTKRVRQQCIENAFIYIYLSSFHDVFNCFMSRNRSPINISIS